MARKQRHAAEHAVVVADDVVIVLILARVAWVEPESRDAVQADGTDEVLAHSDRRYPGGASTTALREELNLLDNAIARQYIFPEDLASARVRTRRDWADAPSSCDQPETGNRKVMIEGEHEANAKALHNGEARCVDGAQLVQVGASKVFPGFFEIAQLAGMDLHRTGS